MALLTVQDRNADPVYEPAAQGGDLFQNDGRTELLIYNPTAFSITVTASAQRRCSHGFLDHWQVNVPAGGLFQFGPFLPSRYNDSSGRVSITYSSASGITVAAKRQA